eukprot:COSAG06_NODE_11429_length_1512_cov_1.083510_1_plen_124_part_00
MTWEKQTHTKWKTVTERVPRHALVTTEDEIVTTTTRNGFLESEELQVRNLLLSFRQRLVAWASSAETCGSHLLSGHGCPQYQPNITSTIVYDQISRRVPRLESGVPRLLLLCTRASCLSRSTS